MKADVRLLGHLQPADLADAYGTASVFALPSYSEGFATVLAEAMDAGLPIVTTGIRGAVDHLARWERTLSLCLPGERTCSPTRSFVCLPDEDLRQAMAAANRAKVGDFAPSVVARDYLRILQEVMEVGVTETGRR